MRRSFSIVVLALIYSGSALAMGHQKPSPDLDVVSSVDIQQYMGKWYEIARLPQRFEKGCVGVTAEYQLRADGKVDVKNTCRRNTCDGKSSTANGLAMVVDTQTNAKLKVSFFWPFKGDYWILELDSSYSYAVVGSPDRQSFWILSRTPVLADSVKQGILTRFTLKGFDLEKIETTQPCESASLKSGFSE